MPNSQLTKNALAQAMKELMDEKPMDKINIKEITERCHMSRKSFYYHFKDKYDLVNWIYYTEFVAEMQKKDLYGWELLEYICQFFYENRAFYSNALRVEAQNSFSEYFMEVLQPIIVDHFNEILENNETKGFFVSFFADATRLAITRWLLEDAKTPPDKFIQLMKTAMTGMAMKIVEGLDENNNEG